MLRIAIPISPEGWDEEKEEFIEPQTVTLELEHSLASISKWESKWHIPFFSKTEKTAEETLDYIKCMMLTPNVDPDIYKYFSNSNIEEINAYIDDSMTATTFPKEDEKDKQSKKETVTAELVYYWMFSLGIPLEFENRHINTLLTLIRVFNVKNAADKKLSPKEAAARNKAINAKNKALLQSKG
jgi:hypothetical protein